MIDRSTNGNANADPASGLNEVEAATRRLSAALDALEATGLPKKTRRFVQDSAHTLQDPKTRQVAMDRIEETGLPDKTRQLLEESTRVLQDAQARATTATRERVMQFADDAQHQARHMKKQVHLPTQVTRRLQKQKPKRFLFA